jgi:hypothetical protein
LFCPALVIRDGIQYPRLMFGGVANIIAGGFAVYVAAR